jgi:hypothetical protein
VSKEEKKAMRKLRRYASKNHPGWLRAYFINGPELIDAIEEKENPPESRELFSDLGSVFFYASLKRRMVIPVVDLVNRECMEDAFEFYKAITVELFQKYTPEIEIKEA